MRSKISGDGVICVSEKKTGKNKEYLDILFTGDLCPRGRTEPLILQGKSSEILSEVKPFLKVSDVNVTNLETPLTKANTPIPKSGPNLKVDPECVKLLKGNFDIALLANNHIGDFDTKPVIETMKILDEKKIKYAGAGKDLREARKPIVFTKKGIKTAILNYAENEFGGAQNKKPGASTLDPAVNIAEIKEASKKSDIVIVVIHGGNEFNPIPSPRMKKTYRAFADAGADAVISIHTHCPQGIEIWNGTPIIYSMGNFLFDYEAGISRKLWWVGYMVKLRFTKETALSLEVIPVTFAPDATKVRVFDKKSRGQFFKYLQKISDIMLDDTKAQKYWEAWCAEMGQHMIQHLKPVDEKSELDKPALAVRNLFTCEAHNELLNTYLRLFEEKRLKQAKEFFPKIKELQEPEFDILK